MKTLGVIHQALLVDLVGAAKSQNIHEEYLGLEVTADDRLILVPIDPEDTETISLGVIRKKAQANYPHAVSEMDHVVTVFTPHEGKSEVRVMSTNEAMYPSKEVWDAWEFHWHVLTNSYKGLLH